MQNWLMLPKDGSKTLNNREKLSGIKPRYVWNICQFKNVTDEYHSTKTSSKEKLDSVEREAKEAEKHGRGVVGDLEAKYDTVKGSATENLTRARDSTENLYNEARTMSEQKVANARDDAQKKVDKAKNGWSSWFNWGKSKADDIESEAERKL